jgi:pimeloyl-ACP methyl ester carboxylesterase
MSSSLSQTEVIPRAVSRDLRELHSTAQGHQSQSTQRQPSRWILWAILIPLLVIPGLTLPPTHASAQPFNDPEPVPRFEWGACDFPIPSGLTEGTDALCGYLIVPESRDIPDSPTIRLAVLILKARNGTESNAPLVILHGGPGGSAIDDMTYLFTSNAILDDRDVILIDQRGSGYSEPRLDCPEYEDYWFGDSEGDDEEGSEEDGEAQALKACKARLTQEGIDAESYTTEENAADIDDLRKALGYEQIDLYGVSYGADLAIAVMSIYPSGIRSVILDSPVPDGGRTIASQSAAIQASIHACDKDPECRSAFPRLTEDLQSAIDRLNEKPITLHIAHPETGETTEWFFDGEQFVSYLANSLRYPYYVSHGPMFIHDIGNGRYGQLIFNAELPSFGSDLISWGTYISVQCASKTTYFTADFIVNANETATSEEQNYKEEPGFDECSIWLGESHSDSEIRGGTHLLPPTSNIPSLVLSGTFDPLTTPDYAHWIAEQLSNSTAVTIENAVHGTIGSSSCVDTMIAQFLDDPFALVDLECAAQPVEIDFFTPKEIVHLPILEIWLGIHRRSPLLLSLVGFYGLSWIILALGLMATAIIFPGIRYIKTQPRINRLTRKWEKIHQPAMPLRARIFGFFTAILAQGTGILIGLMIYKPDIKTLTCIACAVILTVIFPIIAFRVGRRFAKKRFIVHRLIRRAKALSQFYTSELEYEWSATQGLGIPIPMIITWRHLERVIAGLIFILSFICLALYIHNNEIILSTLLGVAVFPALLILLIVLWPSQWQMKKKLIAWHVSRCVNKYKPNQSPWLIRKTLTLGFVATIFATFFLGNLYGSLVYPFFFHIDMPALYGYPRNSWGVTALMGGAAFFCLLCVIGTVIGIRNGSWSKERRRFHIIISVASIIVVGPLSILVFLGHI